MLKSELLISGHQSEIFIWDLKTGKLLKECLEHISSVKCLLQIDDYNFISGSFDKKIKI